MIDLSRDQKHLLSNPFSFKEFSVSMVSAGYMAQLRWLRKHKPEEFEKLKGHVLLCRDNDCFPKICHLTLLERFRNKYEI